MVVANVIIQLFFQSAYYKKKSSAIKLKEALITLFFLRPAVDAFRLATNQVDKDSQLNPITTMATNKCVELATEAIPSCVLQIYVWLTNPEQAGTYALVSIAISVICTGFASAMLAYDMDVDVAHRKEQPKFYGYIPNDHDL